ncbi:hypothetical protein FJY63_04645, partial [Candidatus Sumerlaeota bacterium]|nr:hypothetical protein [Candidatus Sumerlaeota bacterium]
MGRSYLRAICFLGSLVFLSRNAGEITHQLGQVAALLCFAVFCLSYVWPLADARGSVLGRRSLWSVLVGAIALGVGLRLLQADTAIAVGALALAIVGFWFLAKGLDFDADDMPPYVLTAVIFAVFLIAGKTIPAVWYLWRAIAESACSLANIICGSSINFRPSSAGLGITGLVVLLSSIMWLYCGNRRWTVLIGRVAVALVVQILYLILAARLLDLALPIIHQASGQPAEQLDWWENLLSRHFPWNLPLALFLMNVPVVCWVVGGVGGTDRTRTDTDRTRTDTDKAWQMAAVAVGAMIVLLALLCSVPFARLEPKDKPVVFYEKGFLNWEAPQWGQYGPMSLGMFGNLPRFAEALGLTSRKIADITSGSLSDASALAVINLDHHLPTSSTEAIWDFVRSGGTLLVLGDHTAWDSSGCVPLNELLAPTAIAFNLDSADCPIGGWLHCYDFPWSHLTARIGDERNEAGIVVGASLSVRPPAYPLVLGLWGYEDRGNFFRPDRAHLGNMQYDADEPLGDVVLAAAQPYGRGRVVVFGDTSGFVNGILVGSHEFVGRVLRWIAMPEKSALSHNVATVLCLAVMVSWLATVCLLVRKGIVGRWTLLVFALVAIAVPSGALRYRAAAATQPLEGPIAYLDQSHLAMASLEGWRDEGLMGFQANLMRAGLLPFYLDRFDADTIGNARLLTIVAPAKRFSAAEIETVRQYLERG